MIIDPLSINHPYSCNQFLDQLQAYNCNSGVDQLLDLTREIQQSGNYYYQGLVFPNLHTTPVVGAQVTINGTAIIPPGSYVVGMSAYSQLGAGFRLKIFDKGTKASIFYGDYALQSAVAGKFQDGGGTNPNVPEGSGLLVSPFIITGPGVIGWEIVNQATADNRIQVLLDCAVPITNRSIGTVIVSRG